MRTVTGGSVERRTVADRRSGAERRSALDRRARTRLGPAAESPAEHLRNALQLLIEVNAASELDADHQADLSAALDRLRRAVDLLERRWVPAAVIRPENA